MPNIANPEDLVAAKKAKQIATIPAQENLPVWENAEIFKAGLHNVSPSGSKAVEKEGPSLLAAQGQPAAAVSCSQIFKR